MKFNDENLSNEENIELSSNVPEENIQNNIVEENEGIISSENISPTENVNNSPSQTTSRIKYADNITDDDEDDENYEKLSKSNAKFSFFTNVDKIEHTNKGTTITSSKGTSFNFENPTKVSEPNIEKSITVEKPVEKQIEEPKDSVFADIYNTEELENLRVEKEKKSFFKKIKNKKGFDTIEEIETLEKETTPIGTTEIAEVKDELLDVTNLNSKKEKKSLFGGFKKLNKKDNTLSTEINNVEEISIQEDLNATQNSISSTVSEDMLIAEKETANNFLNTNSNIEIEDKQVNTEDLLITDTIEEPITKPKKEKKSLFGGFKKSNKKEIPLDIEIFDDNTDKEYTNIKDSILSTDNVDTNQQESVTDIEQEVRSYNSDVENIQYNEETSVTNSNIEIEDKQVNAEDLLITDTIEEPITKPKKEKKSLFNKFRKKENSNIAEELPNVSIQTEELDITSNLKENEEKEILEIAENIKEEEIKEKPKVSLFDKFKKKEKKSINDLDEMSDLVSTREDFELNDAQTKEKETITFNSFVEKIKPQEETVQSELSLSKFEELSEDTEELPFIPFEQETQNLNQEVVEKETLEITETPIENKKKKFALPIIPLPFKKKNKNSTQGNIEEPNVQLEEQILSSNIENPLFEGGQDIQMSAPTMPTVDPVSFGQPIQPQPQPLNVQTPPINSNIINNKKLLFIIIGAILFIVLMTSIITALFTAKMIQPQSIQTTTPVIDQEAVDKAVEEALNKLQSFNEINKAETNIISKNDTTELPPQLGMDMLGEEKENNVSSIQTTNFNLGNVSFAFPSDWKEYYDFALKATPSNISNIVMLGAETTDLRKTNNMRVTTETLIQEITAKDYIDKTENLMKENFPNLQIRNSNELTVSGREAPTRIYSYELNGTKYMQYQIYIADRDKIYIISFTSGEAVFEKNIKYYNEILKSFRI